MKIDHVTCHPDIGVKLATKHGVGIEECDDAFHDSPTYRLVEAGRVEGENLYYVGGQTLMQDGICLFTSSTKAEVLPSSSAPETWR